MNFSGNKNIFPDVGFSFFCCNQAPGGRLIAPVRKRHADSELRAGGTGTEFSLLRAKTSAVFLPKPRTLRGTALSPAPGFDLIYQPQTTRTLPTLPLPLLSSWLPVLTGKSPGQWEVSNYKFSPEGKGVWVTSSEFKPGLCDPLWQQHSFGQETQSHESLIDVVAIILILTNRLMSLQ